MTIQIAALVFIGLWACWGYRVYEEREGVLAAFFWRSCHDSRHVFRAYNRCSCRVCCYGVFLMTVQYNQIRKDCLRYAEVFRGMNPSAMADQGGLNGLIANLTQSLEFREGENKRSVERFIAELQLIVRRTEHLKPDDRNLERQITITDDQIRAASALRDSGKNWQEISQIIGFNAKVISEAIKRMSRRPVKP